MLQRPNSRGTAAALGTGDYSTHLSAKEQEHVARVTGSPLINNPSGDNRGAVPSKGLVGAIDAREREKRDMKQGINSQAMQQAIAQHQQQAQAQQQYQQQAQQPYQQQPQGQPRVAQQAQYQGPPQQYPQQYGGQRTNPQSLLATGGKTQNYQSPQQYPPQQRQSYAPSAAPVFAQGDGWTSPQPRGQTNADQQRMQYNMSPAASVFAQGGGWTSPPPSIEQQQQFFQQQQQYLQPQEQGQGTEHGRGRGGPGYSGQGY